MPSGLGELWGLEMADALVVASWTTLLLSSLTFCALDAKGGVIL